MTLKLGGIEFHITVDLTMNDLLERDISTSGTNNVPPTALLVLADWYLELM